MTVADLRQASAARSRSSVVPTSRWAARALRRLAMIASGTSLVVGVACAAAGCVSDSAQPEQPLSASTAPTLSAEATEAGSDAASAAVGPADVVDVAGATIAPDALATTSARFGSAVVVVPADAAGDARSASAAVIEAVRSHADAVRRVDLAVAEQDDARLQELVDDHPALIIVVGAALNAVVDRVSASSLDQRFLLVGAQLPEPTDNVAAVVWPGADQRDQVMGGGGASASSGGALVARAAEAVPIGLRAVSSGCSGPVVALG